MCQWLKQSTEITVKVGPFVDETDGKTAETGLTITQPDILLSKNGGALTQKNAAQTLSHDANGFYGVTLDSTDTGTLGRLQLSIHESGALPVWHDYMVVSANTWDSFFSTENLDVNVAEVSDDSTAADNLESACDNYSVTRGLTGTALPAAAADAAGGLIISDAGGLDADAMAASVSAIETDTNELQTDDVPGLIGALNDPTAASIADAVWDEASAGHTDAGKAGAQLWTDIDAILTDTNELQTDDIPGTIAALNDPTAAAIADAVWDEAAAGHTDAGKAGEQLWTDVDAILADTNELQTDDTPGALAAMDAKIDTIDGIVDAIVADTGTDGVVVAAASKTGYALAAAGLDSVDTSVAGVASNFAEMIVQMWRREFKKATMTSTELKTYADNGSDVLTTQALSDAGGTQTLGAAS